MFVIPLARTSPLSRRDTRLTTFDRLFDGSFERLPGAGPATQRTPAMDVAESDSAYTVSFEVPGASREQLKVSVEGRRVVLTTAADAPAQDAPEPQGEQPAAQAKPASDRMLYRERGSVAYARTVSLPAEVDPAASQARFENGVLTLVLAKKVAADATQLSIA